MKRMGVRFQVSGVRFQVSAQPPAKTTAGLIEKETYERRTSNIERPTSNIEFCQFKKILNNTWRKRIDHLKTDSAEHIAGFGSLFLKSIERSVINIGRSMFDVQSVPCSNLVKFHMRDRMSGERKYIPDHLCPLLFF
jgi:hypothetical protein